MIAIYLLLKIVYYGLKNPCSTIKKDGFVQICLVKIQPPPATMISVTYRIFSSDEDGF